MSAHLKLMNSLPLIYWEPERDVMYAEVARKDFYSLLLTVKLNCFHGLARSLGPKVFVNMALRASQLQTQDTTQHSE